MYRTLSDLRAQVNQLIEKYDEDTCVAAWIYTPEDVFVMDEDCNEHYLPEEETAEVLYEVANADYIYQQIGELIDDEVARLNVKKTTQF